MTMIEDIKKMLLEGKKLSDLPIAKLIEITEQEDKKGFNKSLVMLVELEIMGRVR